MGVQSARFSSLNFKFQTIDGPDGSQATVTGINARRETAGYWIDARSGGPEYSGFVSRFPYHKFKSINYPGADGTVPAAVTGERLAAGYVIEPPRLNGVWGFVLENGSWTLLKDGSEGKGKHAVTEIWGINDSALAVGFYENAGGTKIPFELDVPNGDFTDLHPPGATGDAAATGINGKGDITGWETTSTGVKGFFLQAGTYYPFNYPGAIATYALSINWPDQIVGFYVDASNVRHGFLLIGPSKGGGQQVWQMIDAPGGAGGTVVTGINNHDDICGYYVDAYGVQHGFVAQPK